MKTIKNFIIVIISVLSVQLASAQSISMKDPVSFKLKNGLTIIVAENGESKKYLQVLQQMNEQLKAVNLVCKKYLTL
ncbi:hypothetical protein [Pedobacter panaciterrae]